MKKLWGKMMTLQEKSRENMLKFILMIILTMILFIWKSILSAVMHALISNIYLNTIFLFFHRLGLIEFP